MSIRVENLTKIYGTQRAVNNISFSIEKGQIVGFLGVNGAGKSTTMKMITGFLPPTEGNIWLNDLSITKDSLEIRRRIGYLPEHNPMYLEMYVPEFLNFVAKLYHIPSKQIKSRVAEIIEMTGLTVEQNKKIAMLSKGYRQRVGLAQALIHEPEVLILDEPTSGLDPNQVVEIRNLIQEIGKTKTILFSSHILPEVEAIASRVIVIHKGVLKTDSTLAELKSNAKGTVVMKIELEKPGFDFTSLQTLVPEIQTEKISEIKFTLQLPAQTDIRKVIFEESVKQGNSILSMSQETNSLEDIFRELTGTAPANEAAASPPTSETV